MRTLTAIDMAEMVVSSSRSFIGVIVLELHNQGSTSRWAQQFPSLTSEQHAVLDETCFLEYDEQSEAEAAFQRLTLDCAENGTGGVIGGTITLVTTRYGEDDGTDTVAWDLEDDTRPVYAGGGRWTHEAIAERI